MVGHPELNVALPNVATGLQPVATEGLVMHLVRRILQVLEIAPDDKIKNKTSHANDAILTSP